MQCRAGTETDRGAVAGAVEGAGASAEDGAGAECLEELEVVDGRRVRTTCGGRCVPWGTKCY